MESGKTYLILNRIVEILRSNLFLLYLFLFVLLNILALNLKNTYRTNSLTGNTLLCDRRILVVLRKHLFKVYLILHYRLCLYYFTCVKGYFDGNVKIAPVC